MTGNTQLLKDIDLIVHEQGNHLHSCFNLSFTGLQMLNPDATSRAKRGITFIAMAKNILIQRGSRMKWNDGPSVFLDLAKYSVLEPSIRC